MHCQFHPLSQARYQCPQCGHFLCQHCVKAHPDRSHRCVECDVIVNPIGAGENITPFHKRLPESFRYPLKRETLILISALSLISMLLSCFPLGGLLQLLLSAIALSYSFSCLTQTAEGDMQAPPLSNHDLYGSRRILEFAALLIANIVLCGFSVQWFGAKLGGILCLIWLAALPAAIIILGTTNALLVAINPIKQLALIGKLGSAYGLLLVFIYIMAGSVASIHSLLGQHLSLISAGLETLVSYFYLIIVFHMMGYLIYQFQDSFGLSIAEKTHSREQPEPVDPVKQIWHQAQRLIRNGRVDACLDSLSAGVKQQPQSVRLSADMFELVLARQHTDELQDYGSYYLEHLLQHHDKALAIQSYKRLLHADPSFKADRAEVRLQLAQQLFDQGSLKLCIACLNGIQKDFNNAACLPDAFNLMARALTELPGKQQQAAQAKRLAAHYKQQKI